MEIVVGLMSGTSLDGVDAAVIETDGERIRGLGPSLTLPYTPVLRHRLRALLDRASGLASDDAELVATERALTDAHAEGVRALGITPTLIGMHGQTILHDPHGRQDPRGRRRSWQIGDAQRLADASGCPVVHDFRSADVAAGGEGAPLAPLFHAAMLPPGIERPVAILNLGGVANLTFIPESCIPESGLGGLLACDTGPGNALLDDWAMRHIGLPCDLDGGLARQGQVDHRVLDLLMADPFFARPPPKSLDRLAFHRALALIDGLTAADGAATLVAFTATAASRLTLPSVPASVLVAGGGRRNPVLMAALAAAFDRSVATVESVSWDGDALEAQCFGFLAARSRRGLALSGPGTTGVPSWLTGGRTASPRAQGMH